MIALMKMGTTNPIDPMVNTIHLISDEEIRKGREARVHIHAESRLNGRLFYAFNVFDVYVRVGGHLMHQVQKKIER